MVAESKYLDELNANSSAYKVKVKVIEKARPKTSPKKGIIYQSLMLQDDKGNKMRGTLFGDQVEGYQDAFVYNGTYEITNAPIRRVDTHWTTHQGELDHQMGFGGQTVIQPVGDYVGPLQPNYQSINQLPRVASASEKFDVLGIVLFTEAEPRKITPMLGNAKSVREIVIADHSSVLPITVSAWADLAETEIPALTKWDERFAIVGFTALKVYTRIGFSLTTTMSTMVIEEPTGERANLLTQWVAGHEDILADMQSRVLAARDPVRQREITTIAALKRKRAWNTLPEERLRLKVIVPHADLDKINAYLGCSYCNARGDTPEGRTYLCKTCLKRDSISRPRITFTCDVTDGTATLGITAFTGNSSKLLRVSDEDMFRIKHTEDCDAFATIKERLSTEQVVIELGPNSNLARNNVLQWVLKNVCIEAGDDEGQNGNVTQQAGEVHVHSPVAIEAIEAEGVASKTYKDDIVSKQTQEGEGGTTLTEEALEIEHESTGGYPEDNIIPKESQKGKGIMTVGKTDVASVGEFGAQKDDLNTEVVNKMN